MQITTISDTHGLHHQLQILGGDLLIHAGDVCNRGTAVEALAFIEWFAEQDYTYKVFIAGNHDFYFEKLSTKEIHALLPENVFYLNDSGVELGGIKIWGSPITPTFHTMAFNRNRGEVIGQHWSEIPLDTDVLITHGPPFGILDFTNSQLHVGCEALFKSVQTIRPKYHIFGHIHEGFGLIKKEATTYINTSSVDFNYKVRKIPFYDFIF
jgi:Icc-related predicted phosphoesterase